MGTSAIIGLVLDGIIKVAEYIATLPAEDRQKAIDAMKNAHANLAVDRQGLQDELSQLRAEHDAVKQKLAELHADHDALLAKVAATHVTT